MRIVLASITPRKLRLKSGPAHTLVAEFVKRTSRFGPVELTTFESEALLLQSVQQFSGRTPTHLILLDSTGKSLTSSGIAEHVRKVRDSGTQQMLFAIGPADGWSSAGMARRTSLYPLAPSRCRMNWRSLCWRNRCTARKRSWPAIRTIQDTR